MLMSVKFPDGHVQDLIKVPDWDFNWQYTYHFEQPLDIPKGSVVSLVAHLRQLRVESPQPTQAAGAGEMGRGDDR